MTGHGSGRGRKPKPTHLKLIEGNPGKRPIRTGPERPITTMPEPPDHLNADARTEWDRVAHGLHALRLLETVDRAALAARLRAALQELGSLDNDPDLALRFWPLLAERLAGMAPSVTLQPFFSGVVLDVTPQIDEKGNILLHVHPSVSQVSTVNKDVSLGSAGNLTLPLAASATSELDSIVRGTNGQVVAIGGLMRQSSTNDSSAVPGATNVPVLSTLFGAKKRVNQKRELVVLIKPTIVEGSGDWNRNLLDANRHIQSLDPGRGALMPERN